MLLDDCLTVYKHNHSNEQGKKKDTPCAYIMNIIRVGLSPRSLRVRVEIRV
jgi:hypothetical protein